MRPLITWFGRIFLLVTAVYVLVGFAHYSGLRQHKPQHQGTQQIYKLTLLPHQAAVNPSDKQQAQSCASLYGTYRVVSSQVALLRATTAKNTARSSSIQFNSIRLLGRGQYIEAKVQLVPRHISQHVSSIPRPSIQLQGVVSAQPTGFTAGVFSTPSCQGVFQLESLTS